VASLAVFPLQDLFGLGEEAIMNRPSITEGNWAWRFPESLLTEVAARKLRGWLQLYDREGLPEKSAEPAPAVRKKRRKTADQH
jgi:4-alpha-glucanotransferase